MKETVDELHVVVSQTYNIPTVECYAETASYYFPE